MKRMCVCVRTHVDHVSNVLQQEGCHRFTALTQTHTHAHTHNKFADSLSDAALSPGRLQQEEKRLLGIK